MRANMSAACAPAALLAALATMTMASHGPSAHAPPSWRCMRRPHLPWMDANQSERVCASPLTSLTIRGGGVWGIRRRGAKDRVDPSTAAADDDGEYEYEYEYYESDDIEGEEGIEYEYYEEEEGPDEEEGGEDEDALLTTPIPADKGSEAKSPRNLQLVNRASTKAEDVAEGDGGTAYYEGVVIEEEYADEDEDYLLATPIANENGVKPHRKAKSSIPRKAPRAAKEEKPTWWRNGGQLNGKGLSKRRQWSPVSATKAGFVSTYSGGLPSLSLRSSNGRPFYSGWLSAVSGAVGAIVQPIGSVIGTITYAVASSVSRWVSLSFSLLRNTFDFIWYGPVDGVTTTGITSREGGLSALLMSTPAMIAVSSIAALWLMTVTVKRVWNDTPRSNGGRGSLFRRRKMRSLESFDDEAEILEEDDAAPPSVEEELRFLHRDFDSVNPASKDRIATTITKQHKLSSLLRRGSRPKSRRGQREFTIKSIRNWWKERPDKQSIAIIEPQHLRNQHQPLNREIKRLQKQLSVAEQERAMLQQDVQRLQHRLQKANQGARLVMSQNKWLEKQTSKADRMVSKAVEVERKKANEEMGKVRDSMKGVLERERIMMRGRIAGSEPRVEGHNDLDFDRPPNPRRLDGVKIVREIDDEIDEIDEGDLPFRAL